METRDGQDDELSRRLRADIRQGVAPDEIYSLRGPARLVLVTCGGPFNERVGSYRDNIVVTAVPV